MRYEDEKGPYYFENNNRVNVLKTKKRGYKTGSSGLKDDELGIFGTNLNAIVLIVSLFIVLSYYF